MWYLGIDVSKQKLDCALLSDNVHAKPRNKTVPNTLEGVARLVTWLQATTRNTPQYVCAVLEATSVYHERAATALHEAGLTVTIANPANVRHFASSLSMKTKTDAQDARVLARFGMTHRPERWHPPAPEVRLLNALLARLDALETDIRREENRLEKALANDTPAIVCDSVVATVQFLKKQRDQLQKDIDDHINRHPGLKRDRQLLSSIPAVGPKTAQRMLAILNSRRFVRASQFAAYLGLVPIERQSGTSCRQRPRMIGGHARLRAALYMAAVVATRYNPEICAQYQRLLANGKSKMAAIGAAMRKLAQICFGVFKNQQMYQSSVTG